jgi:hypothetical protein
MENQRSNGSNTKTQQKQFGLPCCPYCGKKINPILAWGIKSKGEFGCPQCGGYSNIKLSRPIYWLGLMAVLAAGILLAIFYITGCMHLQLLLCMLIPFFVFTAISPFFVYLQRILPPGYRPTQQRQSRPGAPSPKTHPAAERRFTQQFSIEDRTTQFQKQTNRSQQNGSKK